VLSKPAAFFLTEYHEAITRISRAHRQALLFYHQQPFHNAHTHTQHRRTHTHAHTPTHAHTQHRQTHTHTCTHTYARTHTRTHAQTHTHACTHTHTNTPNMHTHTGATAALYAAQLFKPLQFKEVMQNVEICVNVSTDLGQLRLESGITAKKDPGVLSEFHPSLKHPQALRCVHCG